MLTFIEAISLAGDRAKQNDDAWGVRGARAWVIDGATDLHDAPLSGAAADAAWIAHAANAAFHHGDGALRALIAGASAATRDAFAALVGDRAYEPWQAPIATVLLLEETQTGVSGLDLGDSRVFALDAAGAAHARGGSARGVQDESAFAAQQTDKDKPLLQRAATMAALRAQRASMNRTDGQVWTFGLDPACADHARAWAIPLARPAHLLLCTDGFSALVDRYGAYDGAGLVRAALEKGLHELGRELRAIEQGDAAGAKHPRVKQSDDATALLVRLT